MEKKEAAGPVSGPQAFTVSLNNTNYAVTIDGDNATVNGKSYSVAISEGAAGAAGAGGGHEIKAQLPGAVVKILVEPGASVGDGDTVMVLEAMKMESEIKTHIAGTVSEIPVNVGDQVTAGQTLVKIN